jgi:CheY-like chemotaxis protein
MGGGYERARREPPRILFVDDVLADAKVIARPIEKIVDVTFEPDVDMAVARLAGNEHYIGFVFDMYFGGSLDGIRLLDARNRTHVGVPVLVLTGFLEAEIVMAAAESGAPVVPKGLAPRAFFERFALRCLIQHRCGRRSLATAIDAFAAEYDLTVTDTATLAELCGVAFSDRISARGLEARYARLRQKTRRRTETLRAEVLQHALTLEWMKKGA